MHSKFEEWYAVHEGKLFDRELAVEAWNAAIEAAASTEVHLVHRNR